MFVRWSNLTLDGEEQRQLPGYRDPAAVRRFDAPEALDMRFYEVHAKSVLNRVPVQSRMPFRWTINPYRGCSHACAYCVGPDTQILIADGRTKRIADIEVGESIYGTVRQGAYRRFAVTQVLDKWSSIKPGYAVELEDGTELIASEDHRFLTRRGWKHVIGAQCGPLQRPHLTLNSQLLGPGGCVDAPVVDDDYRQGYLCGLIRGDGHIGSYLCRRPGRTPGVAHQFRLALTDTEALDRAEDYLTCFGVVTTAFTFAKAAGNRREMTAIRTQTRVNVERITELIRWPILPRLSWLKGFLAGIFDAEGSCSMHVFRIANSDPEILAWIRAALGRFGFDYAVEPLPRENGMTNIRLRGGLSERMRFFLGTDPAITRKRTIEGSALKTTAALGVTSIRSVGMTMRLYDITTGTGDFIANGVVSHNCFARPTHKYLDFNSGRDFEREIVVKVNAPEVLRVELGRPSWKREHVALGTNTDPYQWVEGRYRLMEGIWEALRDAANPCSVLTKSPLLLRDLQLMLEIAQRASFTACLSIPTLDERAWRATEPHTPSPRARLEAVAELNRAGIPTGVLIAPLMPGINDAPHQIEPLLELATQAGATSIAGSALHLRGEVRTVFMDWLRSQRPDLVPRYEELYRRRAYAPREERVRLARLARRGGAPGAFWRSNPRPYEAADADEGTDAGGATISISRQESLF
ncbi:MAG: LAGLIDADG family homing endonuclease [Solirubrobacteraceae bacterium]|jgi:DNA repair photolyase